jgi:hypothetical protein
VLATASGSGSIYFLNGNDLESKNDWTCMSDT